jgi:putative redox protein
VKFLVSARGHQILCDQPAVAGGTDAGITPPEFLLASLATCAGYYAAEYLRTRSLPLNGLEVHVNADKELNPARLGKFDIEVTAPGAGGEERHREGVLRAVRRCLIHNTLLRPPEIAVHLLGSESEVHDGAGSRTCAETPVG